MIACPSGGQRSYQGTLAGTFANGTGSATVAITGSMSKCMFNTNTTSRSITAASIILTGTIAITNDAYGAMNLHLVATGVTVNDVVCTGGMDMTLTGTTPSSQPVATGTACGRSGAVPLP